jgi:hypothetical protein
MRIRTIVAASALAATGVIGAVSQSASAGCGVSITVDNDLDREVTVNWSLSKVKISAFGVPATWARLGNYSTTVDPQSADTDSDEETRAFNLGFGCNLDRRYKIYVSDSSGGSFWEYEPSETGWTRDVTPFIDLNG